MSNRTWGNDTQQWLLDGEFYLITWNAKVEKPYDVTVGRYNFEYDYFDICGSGEGPKRVEFTVIKHIERSQ